MRTLTIKEIENRVKLKCTEYKVLAGSTTQATILKHIECGNTYTTRLSDFEKSKIGCPRCARKKQGSKKLLTLYDKQAAITNLKPLEYLGDSKKCKHKCLECGSLCFYKPNYVIKRKATGCYNCNAPGGYSKTEILWLRRIESTYAISLERAGTRKGQHKIGKFSVDGFHKKSKTIFEFNGDFFHNRKKDIKRYKQLSKLGYNVVYVYESDYHKGKQYTGYIKASSSPS